MRLCGGVSVFNNVTARELGLREVVCNELHFSEDLCTGGVTIRVREDNKMEILTALLERYAVAAREAVAFGDGTADIPILTVVGLGIAVCPTNDRVRSCTPHVVESEPINSAVHIVEGHFGSSERPQTPPSCKGSRNLYN
jgi:phosphoserine phosphatase